MIHGHTQLGIKGEFRAILREQDESVVYDSGWNDNLITNQGLLNMGNSSGWASYCHLGGNSTAPSVNDTGLIAWLAKNNSGLGVSNLVIAGPPNYEFSETIGYRFNAGTGTGTIREVGISPQQTNGNITSRMLVSPAIPKSAAQVLDIYWRGTIYRQIADINTSDVDITEDGVSVLYDTISRGSSYDLLSPSSVFRRFGVYQANRTVFFNGTAGAITAPPNGSQGSESPQPAYIYGSAILSAPSAYIDTTVKTALDFGNASGGVRTVRMRYDFNYDVQHQFTDQATGTRLIPKNNTRELELTFRTTWTRL